MSLLQHIVMANKTQDLRWVVAKNNTQVFVLMGYLGNEHEVGRGIKDSGVPREDIFITSKLWNTHHPNVAEGLQKTLDALGTDYLDLYVSYPSSPLRIHGTAVDRSANANISSSTGQSDLFL